jgi:hypothetical protein
MDARPRTNRQALPSVNRGKSGFLAEGERCNCFGMIVSGGLEVEGPLSCTFRKRIRTFFFIFTSVQWIEIERYFQSKVSIVRIFFLDLRRPQPKSFLSWTRNGTEVCRG